jgi:processive 1,2-diacylglycerol beta-glucosyltransferase
MKAAVQRLEHTESAMPSRSPFLCILSCKWGDGHQRVGEAVAAAWRASTGGDAAVLDYFAEFVHPLYSTLGTLAYVEAVRHRPALYGMVYEATDHIRQESGLQRTINRVGMTRLERYLRAERPAVVCCVHCTTAGTMSDLKAAGRTRIPSAAVVTDYDTHAQWIHPNVDRYCVPSDSVRRGFIARGISVPRIAVTGLPVARKFRQSLIRPVLMRELDLRPDRPVILVMAGAYAMLGGVLDIVRVLAGDPRSPQVLVVCGRDESLARRVRSATASAAGRFKVFGYVDDVERLMTASDLLITKAGAVTVSEALVRGLPMLIYRPIPGQEARNTQYLVEHGAAFAPRTPEALRRRLERLFTDPAALDTMRRAAADIARPEAADEVVRQLIELASRSPSIHASDGRDVARAGVEAIRVARAGQKR